MSILRGHDLPCSAMADASSHPQLQHLDVLSSASLNQQLQEGGRATPGKYVILNPDQVNLCGEGRRPAVNEAAASRKRPIQGRCARARARLAPVRRFTWAGFSAELILRARPNIDYRRISSNHSDPRRRACQVQDGAVQGLIGGQVPARVAEELRGDSARGGRSRRWCVRPGQGRAEQTVGSSAELGR